MSGTHWSATELAQLESLLSEKLTAQQIGLRMKRSRNAIIGKVWRAWPQHQWPGSERAVVAKKPRRTAAISLAPVGGRWP